MLFKSAPRFWEKSSFAKEPIRALIDRLISAISSSPGLALRFNDLAQTNFD